MKSLAEIALFTDDVSEASAFYEGLVGSGPVAEWPDGAIFAVGDGKLLVHARPRATAVAAPPNEDHFAISVDDLNATCTALANAGFTFLVEPRDYAWGRSAYLRDPDGRLVELAQA
jgi:catechol 2,3-dioxygenase-like lactoylglutathione lyase family enzyme